MEEAIIIKKISNGYILEVLINEENIFFETKEELTDYINKWDW